MSARKRSAAKRLRRESKEQRAGRTAKPNRIPDSSSIHRPFGQHFQPSDILALQRTFGNGTVVRMLSQEPTKVPRLILQHKLIVGPVDDVYEWEADRMAERVIRAIRSISPDPRDGNLQNVPVTPVLRNGVRRVSIGSHSTFSSDSITPELERAVRNAQGSGRPLQNSTRAKMEEAFSADFRRVRVHNDLQSDLLNRSLESRAFTTGQDIFFRQGTFNPDNLSGQKLLAHELTHVVQQTACRIRTARIQRQGNSPRQRGEFVERRQIMYIAQTKPEGFTLNLKDLHMTDLADLKADPNTVDVILKKFTNYCVAYDETQNCFGEDGLKRVIAHAYSHAGYVGGWKEQGKYFFDSVRVVASEYNAIVDAIKEKQDAYFDLNGQVVRVHDKRGGPVRPEIINKLKSMGKKLTELGVDADAPVPKSAEEASPYI